MQRLSGIPALVQFTTRRYARSLSTAATNVAESNGSASTQPVKFSDHELLNDPPVEPGVIYGPLHAPASIAKGTGLHFGRHVAIYRPERSTPQSASFESSWLLRFVDSKNKFVSPLTGWTAGPDQLLQIERLTQFSTPQDAARFALEEGYSYEVIAPHERRRQKRSYADNFKWKGLPEEEKEKLEAKAEQEKIANN